MLIACKTSIPATKPAAKQKLNQQQHWQQYKKKHTKKTKKKQTKKTTATTIKSSTTAVAHTIVSVAAIMKVMMTITEGVSSSTIKRQEQPPQKIW
jgi:3-polyprenyl-4-hydroxybenzoate decarboxylase